MRATGQRLPSANIAHQMGDAETPRTLRAWYPRNLDGHDLKYEPRYCIQASFTVLNSTVDPIITCRGPGCPASCGKSMESWIEHQAP
jgi:hypothetical protein